MKERLDVLVVQKGLAPSREKAKALIMAGEVLVDGQREDKPGTTFADTVNITVKGNPIPGLYAVGTDGCQLYRETYTMNIPASCQGNNVNSGRTAAKHLCANLL